MDLYIVAIEDGVGLAAYTNSDCSAFDDKRMRAELGDDAVESLYTYFNDRLEHNFKKLHKYLGPRTHDEVIHDLNDIMLVGRMSVSRFVTGVNFAKSLQYALGVHLKMEQEDLMAIHNIFCNQFEAIESGGVYVPGSSIVNGGGHNRKPAQPKKKSTSGKTQRVVRKLGGMRIKSS